MRHHAVSMCNGRTKAGFTLQGTQTCDQRLVIVLIVGLGPPSSACYQQVLRRRLWRNQHLWMAVMTSLSMEIQAAVQHPSAPAAAVYWSTATTGRHA
jgi:hypothetical protein